MTNPIQRPTETAMAAAREIEEGNAKAYMSAGLEYEIREEDLRDLAAIIDRHLSAQLDSLRRERDEAKLALGGYDAPVLEITSRDKQLASLRSSLASVEGERDALEKESISARMLGDAIIEGASRLAGMAEKGDFAAWATKEATRITLRQLVEIGHELKNPGSSKWGTSDTQQLFSSERDKRVSLENELAALRADLAAAKAWKDELQLWGGTPEIVHAFIKGQQERIHATQDIENELAAAKAERDELKAQFTPTSDTLRVRIAEAKCPCCGKLGREYYDANYRGKGYSCGNPRCDVRTFSKRSTEHLATVNPEGKP